MTALAAFLEDFGSPRAGASLPTVSEDILETERLEAFDRGYRAGWDDAIKAKTDEGAQLADEVIQSLQDLSLTYHEVHAQVLANLGPLFDEILQKILPSLARESLGAHVADELTRIARDMGTVQVQIAVAPGAAEHVTQFVNGALTSLPVSVIEASDIPHGRADLRLGRREISVDLSEVTAQITAAVRAALYTHSDQPELRAHG